ncbi:hypothetical protein GCM10029976_085200 [Kribbella albertanoniae]|uniref:DUF1772 domain-containing protein n=1 Tax=Kribbella albertanoniae TaxID=1266829 RepID=A0A4R4Q1Z9_9ACTN|nr:anthrone oxygenase family protein [Kribbella albertanoniae]TDC28987.1 DUF1772 domain-containing protein [Kribbella albertanoniae]
MDKLIRAASLLFSGAFAGFLLGVLVLENSLRAYGADVYTQVRHVELDALDKLAVATLIPALVTTAILVIRARGARRLPLVGLVLLLVVLGTSIAVNLPINADQADWVVQNPPADWAEIRDRWQLAHLVRTIAALSALGVLAGAAVSPARRT